ncbi:magnesium/cobalt transporter CorA [Cytophagaceae bacterium ABcell3]|nr:magnesium/cobalt transporter CorA [Cytophagaceae bacterium ABcell3]
MKNFKTASHYTKRSYKAGLPPGSMVTAENKREKSRLTLFTYNADEHKEQEIEDPAQAAEALSLEQTVWLNIDGLADPEVLEKTSKVFGLHSLLMEDIVTTDQRPKAEEHENYFFVVVRMLSYNKALQLIQSEQVSMILGKNFVLTFQEKEGDLFDPIRERIRKGKGRTVRNGADYLLYSLLDIIVDHYFVILENTGESILQLEEDIISSPDTRKLRKLYSLKREMNYLRKSVWPLREVIGRMEREDGFFNNPFLIVYIRDIYDHTIQVIETIESNRETLSSLMDLYLSGISNKTNAIMKVLTIISTIFIPLTFIVGIYGMNFDNMPELHWQHGYFFVLGVMFLISIGMIAFFKKKGWM